MSTPRNPHMGGNPGMRSPDIQMNPYHTGMPGQRSPWGHSSPMHYNNYHSPRHHNTSQSTPSTASSQWGNSPSPHSPHHPRFTPPRAPNFSPISHRQPFQSPYNKGNHDRNRSSSGGGGRPSYGDQRQGQNPHHKNRRFSGGGGGNRTGGGPPIQRYVKRDMLENPWAQLEKQEETAKT